MEILRDAVNEIREHPVEAIAVVIAGCITMYLLPIIFYVIGAAIE